MTYLKREDRNKIAVEWFATEAEAFERVYWALEDAERMVEQGYDFGYQSIGRAPHFDKDGMFAVVVP